MATWTTKTNSKAKFSGSVWTNEQKIKINPKVHNTLLLAPHWPRWSPQRPLNTNVLTATRRKSTGWRKPPYDCRNVIPIHPFLCMLFAMFASVSQRFASHDWSPNDPPSLRLLVTLCVNSSSGLSRLLCALLIRCRKSFLVWQKSTNEVRNILSQHPSLNEQKVFQFFFVSRENRCRNVRLQFLAITPRPPPPKTKVAWSSRWFEKRPKHSDWNTATIQSRRSDYLSNFKTTSDKENRKLFLENKLNCKKKICSCFWQPWQFLVASEHAQ